MKFIKEIFKYILIFVITVIILVAILTAVACVPRKHVETNLKEATSYFKENYDEVTRTKRNREYTYTHPYADEIILNIIYCLDTDKPLESVLEAKYYTKYANDGTNAKYMELIENDFEGNTEYLRYWHGSIAIIKPLLIFFTLEQIYMVLGITMIMLILINIAVLIRKKYFSIAIAFFVGLILVAIWYVPTTFEYIWTFLIMLVTTLICIFIEDRNKENKNKKLYVIFLITGIITCFLDFLTTEVITILVPLAVVLTIRMKKDSFRGFRKELGFVIKSMVIWFVAYSLMWGAKWIITSIVLNINAMEFVTEKAMVRIDGPILDYTKAQIQKFTLRNNFTTLYPINVIKRKVMYLNAIPLVTFTTLILAIDKKDKRKMKYLLLMLMIAVIPYIRYLVLLTHSYSHSFFTYRSQIVTVMCILLIIINCSSKEKLFKKIKINKDVDQ